MQIVEKKWTWKDAPGAISMALSPTRLLTGMVGLFVVELLAWLFARNLQSGASAAGAWGILTKYIWALIVGGIVLYVLYATIAVIGRSVYLELEEGEGLGIVGSIAFLLKTGLRIALAPLVFLVFMAVMWGLAALVFLVGRVWGGLGAIMFLPLMILIILAGMAGLMAVFGLYIVPGAAGVRKSGALDTVLDTVDMLRGRGVFWGFVITLAVVVFLGSVITQFCSFGISAVQVGTGTMPPPVRALSIIPGGRLLGLYSQAGISGIMDWLGSGRAITAGASGITDWIWVVVLKIFQLLCNSFLLGTFAGAGVIAYLVGSEDEMVVVEEKGPETESEEEEKPAEETKGKAKRKATRKHAPVKKSSAKKKESK